ncbi:hypothetical protein [Halomonas sp. GXIMD04776]|uniref:hypothetical protein n=1 Tax=Halomonas sp. GXIMD04776 TaxID=3415605 RepID=UPI003CC5C4F2
MVASIPEEISGEKERHYCRLESDRLIRGALLSAEIPLLNDPINQSAADHKPYQLITARKIGLDTPATLMTNDPQAVKDFIGKYPSCIFKAFHSPSWRVVETRKFHDTMLEDLESLRFAPAIFQEYIPLYRDIRVMAMPHKLFAFAVEKRSDEAFVDWRLDGDIEWQPVELPTIVRRKLTSLLSRLGLAYGSIDLRETPDNRWVFLEINPAGQFLFLEEDGGCNIADEFCQLLIHPPNGNPPISSPDIASGMKKAAENRL